jgi:hypothetical protein
VNEHGWWRHVARLAPGLGLLGLFLVLAPSALADDAPAESAPAAVEAPAEGQAPAAAPEQPAQQPAEAAPAPAPQRPPVVPRIDQALKDRLRGVYLSGLEAGRRPTVFAKIGDSITASRYFLEAVGCGYVAWGEHEGLAPTLDYFRQTEIAAGNAKVRCGLGNSFTRRGVSAVIAWTSEHALAPMKRELPECPAPDNIPLRCELVSLSPSIALVMYGTNEVDARNPARFYAGLNAIVQNALELKVIPVLSTIPPRLDRKARGEWVIRYNEVIAQVAREQGVPLWDYWQALQAPEVQNQGLNRDGIHPNVFRLVHPGNFTPDALRFGYNLRNLTALQTLDKLRRVVIEDGAPDP